MRFKGVRWLLAAGCLALSAGVMAAGLKIEGFGAIGHLAIGILSFIVSVLLVSPETVFRLAEWCSKPFTNIIFPSEEFSKPPLSYVLARRYAENLRWEDAIEEYEKIIHYYPKERDAYIELIAVARKLGDNEVRRKYATLFKRRFRMALPEAKGHQEDDGIDND